MDQLLQKYRRYINPPYSSRDIPVVLGTLLLLIMLPIILINMQLTQNTKQEAAEPDRLPVVSIKAPNKIVSFKQIQNSSFTISRQGNNNLPLNVYYTKISTLEEDSAGNTEGMVIIPEGVNKVEIPLNPVPGNQDIMISLKENDTYEIGPQGNDIVQIVDAEDLTSPDQKRPVIVTLKNVDPESVVASNAIDANHLYKNVFKGFSARLSNQQIQKLLSDPNVTSIEDDHLLSIQVQSFSTGASRTGLPTNTQIPFGTGYQSNIDVAVLDTGIDTSHPDLNVVGGKACVSGNSSYVDDHGHGTKVAGNIAAKDNDYGVVGGAPGARLWSVKVADSAGSSPWSAVICGLDFVTANAATIKVANISIAGSGSDGSCTSSSLHNAICKATNAGVTIAVSSGNYGVDASTYVPAAFDEVLTIGAIVDTDGKPGGLGASTAYGPDDSIGSFSNYGSDVDFVAPGYNILSTTRGGGYGGGSGTSFSSPIVAGAAAFYMANNPTATPLQVKQALISSAALWNNSWGYKQIRASDTQPLIWQGSTNPNDSTSPTSAVSTPIPTNTPQPTPTPLGPSSTPTPTLVPDNILPTVSITSPLNNSIINRRATVTIAANATDNIGVDRVVFTVAGNVSTDYAAPYSYVWSVAGKPNATYTITATAYDTAGNSKLDAVRVTTSK